MYGYNIGTTNGVFPLFDTFVSARVVLFYLMRPSISVGTIDQYS